MKFYNTKTKTESSEVETTYPEQSSHNTGKQAEAQPNGQGEKEKQAQPGKPQLAVSVENASSEGKPAQGVETSSEAKAETGTNSAKQAVQAVNPQQQVKLPSEVQAGEGKQTKGGEQSTGKDGNGQAEGKALEQVPQAQALQQATAQNKAASPKPEGKGEAASPEAEVQNQQAKAAAEQGKAQLETTNTQAQQLASAGVNFAPPEEQQAGQVADGPDIAMKAETPSGDAAALKEQNAKASSIASSFVATASGKVQTIAGLGAGIPTRIQGASENAKAKVTAAVEQQKAAVAAQFTQQRAKAQSEAQATIAKIQAQYQAAVGAIPGETAKAREKVNTEYATSVKVVDARQKGQITQIEGIYARAAGEFRNAGARVGDEAVRIANQKASEYKSRDSGAAQVASFLGLGAVSDVAFGTDTLKNKARGQAAEAVGQAYKEQLVAKGNECAQQAEQGKQKDIDTVRQTAAKSRETLQTQQKAALDSLNVAEQQAKQQAQQAQTQLSQTANQSLEATLTSLDQQQATQLQMLTAQGQQQIAAIEGSAQKAIASLQNAINQSASGLRGTLQTFQAQAKSAQAPDPNALSAAVSQAQGQIDGEIGKIRAQVEQGIAASVQSITQSGQQSVEGLSSIGQGAIESATTLSQGLTTTMTGLAQSATDTFKQIQQTHTKTTTETAKTAVDGFKQVSEGIDKTFQEMSKGLESQFQQHVKEVEKALRGALNDLPGVINKEAEDAAAKVDPKKELLKLVVIVAVVVVAALVVGPFAAGLLAPLGAMGTILAGAAVGALSGAAIQMASNALDGKDILEGVGQALLFGAIGGALGAGIGMAVGGVLRGAAGSVAGKVGERAGSGLRAAGNFALDVAEETIGDIATNIATGQFSWDNIGESLLFSVVGAGVSRSGAGQRISDGAQNRGTQIGNNVSDRVRNAFGGSTADRPNVDVSTPGKPPVSQETAPTKPPVAEETAPVKPPISEEAVPAKPPVTEETTVIKPPAVEETTPAKPPIVEEAVPHKPPVTEETVPTKPPVSQETTPLKSPAAEETTPAKPPVEQETMPTKPPASQETTPVKPPATEETTSTQQPVAGVRGNDVYEATNTYNKTHTEPDGTTTTTTHGALERPSGLKDIGKRLNQLTKSEYENGAVIKDVVPGTADSPTTFKVEIPNSTPGQPPHVVEVTVKPLPTAALAPGAHGPETGPARMDLQHVTDASGAGKWTARIELDSALHVQDLPHIIGHEVNELAGIVSQHPTGATPKTLEEQMAAGVFSDGSTATKPTAHDLAAARELRSLYEDKNNLLKSGASPDKIASREQSIQKTLKWMGLNEPGNIDVKLKTLREAGLPPDVIEQVKLVGARAELQTHINAEQAAGKTQTIFHDEAVNHLMFPEDTGASFKSSGINGGHQTQRLLDFANNHKSIVVVEQSSKAAGGTTFRKYDQYKWKGTGPKPSLGDPRLPGGPNYNPNDWVKAPYPKTTADDLQGLMREANAGWENFMSTRIAAAPNAAPPGPSTDGKRFEFGMGKPAAIAPGSAIPFGGFATYDGTRGQWVLSTVFVEGTWF